eukprot:g8939.t1
MSNIVIRTNAFTVNCPSCWKPRIRNRQLGHSSRTRRPRVTLSASSRGDMPYLRDAAIVAVDKFVESGNTVALGTGEMSTRIFEYLKQCLNVKALKDIVCVTTTDVAATEAAFQGIPHAKSAEIEHVDVMFQELDQVDSQSGAFIFGRQTEPHQPQIMKARLVMKKAKQCIGLIDNEEKITNRLNGTVPICIDDETWEDSSDEIDTMFLPNAEVWRRPVSGQAGPTGGPTPYISPEGHNIIDVRFNGTLKLDGEECDYKDISKSIYTVDGVVTHGLVVDVLNKGVVASPLGTRIIEWEKESSTLTD